MELYLHFHFSPLLASILIRLIQPFCFCPCLITDEHPHLSLSSSHYTSLLLLAHSPILSDLTVLPLFHPIFSCSSQCFNSIMDAHKAQFASRAFSIISPVNSLAVPASPLHVFVEAGLGSRSAFTLLTLSLHQPDAQLL